MSHLDRAVRGRGRALGERNDCLRSTHILRQHAGRAMLAAVMIFVARRRLESEPFLRTTRGGDKNTYIDRTTPPV
jgi:hypothetical protein